MKLRELISKTIKSMAVLSLFVFTASNCKAAETINYYSAVKDNILQSKPYDEFYDVNDDGVVNVFDAIRINQNECHENLKKELSDLKSEIDAIVGEMNAKIEESGRVIEVGRGRDYESLAEAVYIGVQSPNTTIIVYPETHDFVSEISTLDTQNTTGLSLYNNVYIKFLPGAKIVCNYEGSNTYINQNFSVFNADIRKANADFTLDGVEIISKNIRYCIHDEMHNSTAETYKHVYKNCKFSIDNSLNPVWNATQCIGGGLGVNGEIEVDNCIFDTVETGSQKIDLSYHNDDVSSCVSRISIKNSWFSGTVRFGYHGTSPLKTMCIVSGCSLASDVYKSAETGTSLVDNMIVYKFNNEIRS